jgi:hypothetical protein
LEISRRDRNGKEDKRIAKMTTKFYGRTEARTDNKVLPKAGVSGFHDTFVLNRTLVFQINSSAETPRLRQYPNRCAAIRRHIGRRIPSIDLRRQRRKSINLINYFIDKLRLHSVTAQIRLPL